MTEIQLDMQQTLTKDSNSHPFSFVTNPIHKFFQQEAAGGILLMVSAVIAIIWANSPFADSYFHLWHTHVDLDIGALGIHMHLLHWINDGLMAIFFLLVGLEIKREVLSGELASKKKAALPVAAAIGGMVVPALIYVGLNTGTTTLNGWGVPMATDIAFALGIIILLGKRVPVALKVFLVALAIVDDLGAVLVIAFFYTSKVSLTALGVAGLFLVAMITANKLGVRRLTVYCILGAGLWVAFLKSGIHATLAGVLMAMTIPMSRKISPFAFMETGKNAMYSFMGATSREQKELNHKQEHAIHEIEHASKEVTPPSIRLEHALHSWVSFLIMPVFAFANAGVSFAGVDIVASLTSKVTLGIILGLFVGKQLGVFAFSWLAIKSGIAEMPARTTWKQIYGVSMLSGIGFTMSLFIASLAFGEGQVLDLAKLGIFIASLLAGIGGWFILSSNDNPESNDEHGSKETNAGAIYVDGRELKTQAEIEEFFKPRRKLESV